MKRERNIAAFACKLGGSGGFSLLELMVCMLILLLSTGVILQTLTLATTQFQKRTHDSEAELLCDMLAQAVQEQLTYVTQVTPAVSGDLESFYSTAGGLDNTSCRFTLGASADHPLSAMGYGEIMLTYADSFGASQSYGLIPSANYIGSDGSLLYAFLWVNCEADRFAVTLNVYDETEKVRADRQFVVYPALDIFA